MLDIISNYKWYIAAFYFTFMSVMAIIITAYDKIAAKKWQQYRISEATLLAISALGGSVAMLLTMLIIRHKTLHKKFMIGIPLIMALQISVVVALICFGIISY